MSRRNIYGLIAVGLVVVAAGYYFLMLSPLRTKIGDTEAQIASEQTQLAQNQARLAQMEQTRQDAKRNQARLIELSKMVPQTPEIPSLLLQIQDLATEAGIDFLTITPQEPTDLGSFLVIGLVLVMEGRYFDVNDFLYRAEQMAAGPGRILAPKQVDLSLGGTPESGASPKLKANITLQAFERKATAPTEAPAPTS
ncbi:MAG: type 4a pilus biogenesis protein PilO [Thermoleophilia bacterium]|nr:type 4a pilus biogenesis protein PilO [Thermoleophilia bacterium]